MNPQPNPNLDVVLDVKVKLSVELGSCLLPLREVLMLKPGSVVPLDKLANSPVDLFVNGKKFAAGEVVVVDDCFGLKITEIYGAAA